MHILRAADIWSSEITDPALYLRRRQFLQAAAALTGAAIAPALACAAEQPVGRKLTVVPGPFGTDEERTPREDATSYNNFYEFGTHKGDAARHAHQMKTDPWSVEIAGEVAKPGRIGIEDLIRPHTLEERVYRLRCVEAWSMVIPWVGFPLGDVLKRFEPTSKARYVSFETLVDREQMPGQ